MDFSAGQMDDEEISISVHDLPRDWSVVERAEARMAVNREFGDGLLEVIEKYLSDNKASMRDAASKAVKLMRERN